MTWQPIETAPKDGTAFIGAFQYDGETDWEIHEFEWNEHAFDTDSQKSTPMFVRPYADITSSEDQPILWQPMPSPPAASAPNPQQEERG